MRRHAELTPLLAVLLLLAYPTRSQAGVAADSGLWSPSKLLLSTAVHLIAMPSDSADFHTTILSWRGAHKDLGLLDGGLIFWRMGNEDPANTWAAANVATANLDVPAGADIFCGAHNHLGMNGVNGAQKYLIVGGTEPGAGETGTANSRIFNPATLRWEFPSTPMASRRWYPDAVTLPTGKVLTASGSSWVNIHVYGGLRASDTGSKPTYRDVVRAKAMPQGGFDAAVPPPGTDPNLWPEARHGHTFTRFGSSSHKQILFGGVIDDEGTPNVTNTLHEFTRSDGAPPVPETDDDYAYAFPRKFPVGAPPSARSQHGACVIDRGLRDLNRLVVWGGLGDTGGITSDVRVWLYGRPTPTSAETWVAITPTVDPPTASPPAPRFGHAMFTHGSSDTVIVFGGTTTIPSGLNADSSPPQEESVWVLTFNASRDGATWKQATLINQIGATGPGPLTQFASTSFEAPHRPNAENASSIAPRWGGVLYGGRRPDGSLSSDVWMLFSRPTMAGEVEIEWDLLPTGVAGSAGPPTGRTGMAIAWIDGTHDLYVLGGRDGSGAITGDVRKVHAILHSNEGSGQGKWVDMPDLTVPVTGASAFIWDDANYSRVPEVFSMSGSTSTWTPLPGANLLQPWYPFLFLAKPTTDATPKPQVFAAGPMRKSYWFTTDGAGTVTAKSDTSQFIGGSAVMYEPGRIMKSGSRDAPFQGDGMNHALKRTQTIDLNATTPTWVEQTSQMAFGRVNENLVLLPSGQALCTGGTGELNNSNPTDAVRWPQIWTPPASGMQGTWGPILRADPLIRDYHNSALLLGDGRVLTGGANWCTNFDDDCDDNDQKMEVFSPPYLFASNDAVRTRPRILSVEGLLKPGDTFTVITDVAIDEVTLVRGGSVTHGFDQGQLFVRPTYVSTPSGSPPRKTYQLPANGYEVPPVFYQLFALKDGMPSISRWIHIRATGQSKVGLSDIGDPVRPAVVALSISQPPYCAGETITFTCVTPAEDSTLGGVPDWYELRVSPSLMTGRYDLFEAATLIPDDVEPVDVGGTQTLYFSDLQLGQTHKFALASRDDRASRRSVMSNVVSAHVVGCDYGLLAGDPPTGGGFSAGRAPGLNRLGEEGTVASQDHENSLLPGVVPGLMRTDLMPLQHAPAADGDGYRLSLRRGHHGGSTLSDVRLVALDTAEEGCWVAEDGSFLAGASEAATAVNSSAAGDVLAGLGDDAHPHTANAGDTLLVTLPIVTGNNGMWLRTMGSPTQGSGGDYGVLVQKLDDDGQWTTVQHLRPRRRYSDAVVRGLAGSQVRLVVLGQTAISSLGRVVSGATAPTIHEATAASAEHSRLGTLTATALAGVVLAADESMTVLTSSLPEPAAGTTRHWYLRVTGEHDAEVGSSTRASQGHDEDPAQLRFALQSVRPNPSHGHMTLSFTTPREGSVKLEAFDLIGRRVASMVQEVARPGRHELAWEAKGQDGRRLSPGTYVVRLSLGGARVERKVLVMP